MATDHISEDLLAAEILWRLDVKPLSKFKCVSKTWCSLISSKQFVKIHLKRSMENTDLAHKGVLMVSFNKSKDISIYPLSLSSAFSGPFNSTIDFDCEITKRGMSRSNLRVVGCCNGLCCLGIGNEVFLWNPSTRISKKLPSLFEVCCSGGDGFGYDESTDDYIVLATSYVSNDKRTTVGNLYSLRTNSWKTIEDASCGSGPGKFVNGKLHWFDWKCSHSVVYFDLIGEKHGNFELPNFMKLSLRADSNSQALGVLDGCLCVAFNTYNQGKYFEVWALKQYENKKSWQLVASIPDVSIWHEQGVLHVPLYISKKGEILILYELGFRIYDPNTTLFIPPQMCWCSYCIDAQVYVKSLVSPFLDGETEESNWHEWIVSKEK